MSRLSLVCLITCQIRTCLIRVAGGIEESCEGAEREITVYRREDIRHEVQSISQTGWTWNDSDSSGI